MIKAIVIAMLIAFGIIAIPAPVAIPNAAALIEEDEQAEWSAYHAEAMAEYADEFTALFNSYETRIAKNGRMMIRTGNSGPYKFARKA